MSDVLFQITKDQLETGLRGYPVGYCTTSVVDPIEGLFYVGHPVSQIGAWQPEEVIFLLYYGRKGEKSEIEGFKKELNQRADCSKELISQIEQLPKKAGPMKLFTIAILLAGVFEGKGSYREDGLNLVAKIPEIAARVINFHAGWKTINSSQPELGYMENFLHLLNFPKPTSSLHSSYPLIDVLKLFNILHFDHGGGNLSTFVGKAVASGLEDMYGSIAAAMAALAGARHGKANQEALHLIHHLIEELGEDPTVEQVEQALILRLDKKEIIGGFGHAVLRVEDPRATLLYSIADQYFSAAPLVRVAGLVRAVGPQVLKEHSKIVDPNPNVDAISGVLLSVAGFPYAEYYTILFGLARCVGISRQIIYEREEAREGKGTPIVRPKYFFKNLI